MIRTASDQIVLQPSARTLRLCVGRASGPRSVDMRHTSRMLCVSLSSTRGQPGAGSSRRRLAAAYIKRPSTWMIKGGKIGDFGGS